MNALKQGIELYESDPTTWTALVKQAMQKDFSWNQSSDLYVELYNNIKV
jgi:starch synthase